jgi:predicted RNA binding protein YcfA (HicA-like mRNA interferase family)
MVPRKPSGQKKLRPVKVSKVIKVFERLGYRISAHDGTSHIVMRKEGALFNLSIPVHGAELYPPIINSLIKKAGLTRNEFLKLLDRI